jgi:hypothetical protein
MEIDKFSSAVPVVATSDLLSTIQYFEQTLGFKQQWIWGDPPVYAHHCATGADVVEALTTRPWGVRQYVLREPNGYLLKVAESQKQEK